MDFCLRACVRSRVLTRKDIVGVPKTTVEQVSQRNGDSRERLECKDQNAHLCVQLLKLKVEFADCSLSLTNPNSKP